MLTALTPALDAGAACPTRRFEKPVPGPLFAWVKRFSWVELAIFSGLIVFWLAARVRNRDDGVRLGARARLHRLCVVIWIACVQARGPLHPARRTLTPVGPVGSVIGIELIEREGWGVAGGLVLRNESRNRRRSRSTSIALDRRAVRARYS